MNFAFFDPGEETGIAIFSDDIINGTYPPMWKLLNVSTLRYNVANRRGNSALIEFYHRLAIIKRYNQIAFAVIEGYENLGRRYRNAYKMYHQQRIIEDVFGYAHITLTKNQWDPGKTKLLAQKAILMDAGFDVGKKNEHERDVLHMATNIFRRLPFDAEHKAYELHGAATFGKKIKLM